MWRLLALFIPLCETNEIQSVVLSGGVFQNSLLVSDVTDLLQDSNIEMYFR